MRLYTPRVLHFSAFHCILDCGLAHLVQSCTILHPNVLNLSDHLPITVNLNLQTPTTATPLYKPKFNWRRGVENGSVEAFAADVTNFLSSLLQAPIPSSLEELDQEIIYVGKMLHGVACNTVPVYKKKKKKFYYDESLAKKCAHNKEVWNEWKNAGKPRSGILFENLQKSKYDVKKHLRRCRGEEERKRVKKEITGSKLMILGDIIFHVRGMYVTSCTLTARLTQTLRTFLSVGVIISAVLVNPNFLVKTLQM